MFILACQQTWNVFLPLEHIRWLQNQEPLSSSDMVRKPTLFWLFFVQPGEIQWDACQVMVGRKPSKDTWAVSLREDVSLNNCYFYHHRSTCVHRALTSCHQVCSLSVQQWLWATRTACIAFVTVSFEFFSPTFLSNIALFMWYSHVFFFAWLSLVSLQLCIDCLCEQKYLFYQP